MYLNRNNQIKNFFFVLHLENVIAYLVMQVTMAVEARHMKPDRATHMNVSSFLYSVVLMETDLQLTLMLALW